MSHGQLGPILALMGLALLVVTTMGRQRLRRGKQRLTPGFILWQRVGTVAAYGFILVGLMLMWK